MHKALEEGLRLRFHPQSSRGDARSALADLERLGKGGGIDGGVAKAQSGRIGNARRDVTRRGADLRIGVEALLGQLGAGLTHPCPGCQKIGIPLLQPFLKRWSISEERAHRHGPRRDGRGDRGGGLVAFRSSRDGQGGRHGQGGEKKAAGEPGLRAQSAPEAFLGKGLIETEFLT